MPAYLTQMCIHVFPFTQQPDGEEMIIANAAQSSFLSLPTSAVDILLWLAEGKTVGEAQALYEQKYGDYPDIDELLALLESEGFVSSQSASEGALNTPSASGAGPRISSHFTWISENTARLLFSLPVLVGCFLLIGVALALLLAQPSLFPSANVLVFKQHPFVLLFCLFVFNYFAVFFHEIAHLTAARALGIPARLSLGNRLWALVVQTDVTGIWMVPRRKRYLVVLAGPLLDAVSASLLVVALFSERHGWLSFSPLLTAFCQAVLYSYFLRLLWECYFFVRTDFYYVFVTLFKCKNLMQDTQSFLANHLTRVLPIFRYRDLSAIPAREMTIIRLYALLWLVGRFASFYTLFFISLPVLWGYGVNIVQALANHSPLEHLSPFDLVSWIAVTLIIIANQGSGLLLWVRSLLKKTEVKE
ncbi:MAG TPA: hypothetical protein VJ761_12450 [Ktedonobacteraceae bacterium]|nr:hypothetical protein [Ktedonobacteraceae bacterium]